MLSESFSLYPLGTLCEKKSKELIENQIVKLIKIIFRKNKFNAGWLDDEPGR